MMDAVAVGEIFSSPSAQAFYDAFMSVDSGKGVACLFGNYAGDNMNVKMAIRKAKKQGVTVKYVVATDDVASSPKETKEKTSWYCRRSVHVEDRRSESCFRWNT